MLKPCSIALDNLVICNLRSRKYYDTTSLENGNSSVEEGGPVSPKTPISPPLTPDGASPITLATSAGDAEREEVVKVVNRYSYQYGLCK